MADGVTSGSEWQGRGWKEPSPVTIWTIIPVGQLGLANLCGRKRLLMTCFEKLNMLLTASHVIPLQLPETDIIVPNLQMRKLRLRNTKRPAHGGLAPGTRLGPTRPQKPGQMLTVVSSALVPRSGLGRRGDASHSSGQRKCHESLGKKPLPVPAERKQPRQGPRHPWVQPLS